MIHFVFILVFRQQSRRYGRYQFCVKYGGGGIKVQSGVIKGNREPEIMNIKRNPYLVDYEEQRRQRERRTGTRNPQIYRVRETQNLRAETERRGERRTEKRGQVQAVAANRDRKRREAILRRRMHVRRQRLAVCVFILSIAAVICFSLTGKGNVAAEYNKSGEAVAVTNSDGLQSGTIQGLPAVEFAAHPTWTEDFLTPNEYSRPGEALPEVTNIFVHYTANPGTSAAQNRSYFEQQKDMHEASVSAHFIIGYEGEIIQCIPLDEIAYAVQTRNYDSVSIECCYKDRDGSFTQETYDSLIALLAWLTDIYDLETEDILRHYDCGGKKCPLYYTDHPDAWERLKEDVAEAMQ